jgi:uncharacterized protein (TIGR01777 family)
LTNSRSQPSDNKPQTIIITGGTGLIGTALARQLESQGHKIIIFTREPTSHQSHATESITYAGWNVKEQFYERDALMKADAIIHLAGAGIADKRWTASRKKEILESRVNGSKLLIKAIRETPNKIKTVISASAIGWYGPDPRIPNTRPFIETDDPFYDFLAETCMKWEESINPVAQFGKRLVKLRTGLVLSNDGGALPEFKKSLRFGAAGIISSGRQVVSWIHIDDLCRMYALAIEDVSLEGVYNAVAPKPVPNKELIVKLAKGVKGSFYVPVYIPAFAIRLAVGELSIEVLKSTTVNCDKIRKAGFNFLYPSIDSAMNELLEKR